MIDCAASCEHGDPDECTRDCVWARGRRTVVEPPCSHCGHARDDHYGASFWDEDAVPGFVCEVDDCGCEGTGEEWAEFRTLCWPDCGHVGIAS